MRKSFQISFNSFYSMGTKAVHRTPWLGLVLLVGLASGCGEKVDVAPSSGSFSQWVQTPSQEAGRQTLSQFQVQCAHPGSCPEAVGLLGAVRRDVLSEGPPALVVGRCTAFLIQPNVVMTNGHCVAGVDSCSDDVVVQFPAVGGKPSRKVGCSRILHAANLWDESDRAEDLALLELKESIADRTPLSLADEVVRAGDPNNPRDPKYSIPHFNPTGETTGDIRVATCSATKNSSYIRASYRNASTETAMFRALSPCNTPHGSSGSPVLDQRGRVVALLFAGLDPAALSTTTGRFSERGILEGYLREVELKLGGSIPSSSVAPFSVVQSVRCLSRGQGGARSVPESCFQKGWSGLREREASAREFFSAHYADLAREYLATHPEMTADRLLRDRSRSAAFEWGYKMVLQVGDGIYFHSAPMCHRPSSLWIHDYMTRSGDATSLQGEVFEDLSQFPTMRGVVQLNSRLEESFAMEAIAPGAESSTATDLILVFSPASLYRSTEETIRFSTSRPEFLPAEGASQSMASMPFFSTSFAADNVGLAFGAAAVERSRRLAHGAALAEHARIVESSRWFGSRDAQWAHDVYYGREYGGIRNWVSEYSTRPCPALGVRPRSTVIW